MDKRLEDLFAQVFPNQGKSLTRVWDVVFARLGTEVKRATEQRLAKELNEQLASPPKIAIIGKAGTGKSSTINALFGTDLPVSHVEPCTKSDHEITVDGSKINGQAGDIILYDMPGLGEDIEADEEHKKTYAKVISQCDVAVWVMAATDRALAFDQMMLRDVVSAANEDITDRIVIGLNKVDEIQPGRWVEAGNIPSSEQKESIERKVAEIQSKLLGTVPDLIEDRIVPYSALRRYRLVPLFEVMMNACDEKRAWVLHSRMSVADFEAFVSPEILGLSERER